MSNKSIPGPWTTDGNWAMHGEAREDMLDYRVTVRCHAPFTENEHGDFERVDTQAVATVYGRTPEEAKANARQISAGSELIEALEAHEAALDYRAITGRAWVKEKAIALTREARIKSSTALAKAKDSQ